MQIEPLPLTEDIETKEVHRKTAAAHSVLAELKGVISRIPNENMLIETLALGELYTTPALKRHEKASIMFLVEAFVFHFCASCCGQTHGLSTAPVSGKC